MIKSPYSLFLLVWDRGFAVVDNSNKTTFGN
jgi:hypothetical protein